MTDTPEIVIATDSGADQLHYIRAVLRDDQIELIARRVIELLDERDSR